MGLGKDMREVWAASRAIAIKKRRVGSCGRRDEAAGVRAPERQTDRHHVPSAAAVQHGENRGVGWAIGGTGVAAVEGAHYR